MKKFALIASFWMWSISVAFATESFEDRFLNLGVDEDFTIMERGLIKDQVKNFIPPLLVPAIGGHAYVLPPGLFNFSTNFKFVNVDEDDWYKDGKADIYGIHRENQVQRRFLTSSLKYGFDLNRKYFHSFTAVLNLTYESSVNRGPVRLPDVGNNAKSVYNTGTSEGLQDINIMIKKKIWDQGNKPIGWAIAAGVYLPTGDSSMKAGDNGVISVVDDSTGAVAKPTFKRFTDTGELPAGRQLGFGKMSFKVASFWTRQFLPGDMPSFLEGTKFDRLAVHWGVAYRFNQKHEGVDPGDTATIFASTVVPVYKDYVSLQVSSINKWQENDHYDGDFKFPNQSAAAPRPDFRGGWLNLVGPSLIYSPDPLVRFTATYLQRVHAPYLGPSPSYVVNLGAAITF
ncbi:MAG: hypothetical protein CL489_17645 [Acidobacteria bacterium]|mgnify:FL=1|nr:hypothetical protein [Acidobacteriota bacterium]|tara:strand:- start:146 stop:1342 length:1197 start_codon:yes stop_codon:yes gene_type:complete